MERLTFKPGAEVYDDPAIPPNELCVFVDNCPILKETVHQPQHIQNYFSAYNFFGLAAFFINRDKVQLDLVETKSPFGGLKFTNLLDPTAYMICDLFQIRKNEVFYEIYQITEDHSTDYCYKSPKQLLLELEERRRMANLAIKQLHSN